MFLDCIQRYPKKERIQSVVNKIKRTKEIEMMKIIQQKELRKQERIKQKLETKSMIKLSQTNSFLRYTTDLIL